MRKNILKYDNVMNDQRKVVFEQRREMMAKDSLEDMITDMRGGVVDDLISKFCPSETYPEAWDIAALDEAVQSALNLTLPLADWQKEEGISDEEMDNRLQAAANAAYAARVERNGADVMRYVEKQIVLQVLDHLWREHLVTLDYLRQVIGWRGMAQRDPLNEYKSEAFELFDELITRLRELTTAQLSRVEVAFEPVEPALPPTQAVAFDPLTGGGLAPAPQPAAAEFSAAATLLADRPQATPATARDPQNPASWGKVGRNEACPCGSGKKYKHCHGAFA
jgi:preprotein translocase subunit SecA